MGQQAAGRYQQTIVQGGVKFTLEHDSPTRTAIVDGKAVKMEDRNVAFVDDVDSAAGPRVTGTMRIESRMLGSAGQIGLLLRDSPEIKKTFLRCDATSPDGLERDFSSVCAFRIWAFRRRSRNSPRCEPRLARVC